MLGIDKKGWEGIHTIFCILFLVSAFIHLALNWKSLLHYMFRKKTERRGFPRELAAVALLVFIVFTLVFLQIPPTSKVMEWRNVIKDGSLLVEIQPPEPYFERRSLKEISDFLGVSIDYILRILNTQGIKVTVSDDSLEKIADQNNLTPQNLFGLILQGIPDP